MTREDFFFQNEEKGHQMEIYLQEGMRSTEMVNQWVEIKDHPFFSQFILKIAHFLK